MMKASIDTDIVIHLYLSNKQGLFFEFFDELYMHEYLYENELKRKSFPIYKKFSSDVVAGKVKIITNKNLIEMGVKSLFDDYKSDYEYLFDSGELYAVSLAKTMGLFAFLSDDTKEFGPHYTLVEELIEDVIPFAFYELLFLKYLSGKFTVEEMCKEFNEVTFKSMNRYPMKFKSRIARTVKRFSKNYGSMRDVDWIQVYCKDENINYRVKMIELKRYLRTL